MSALQTSPMSPQKNWRSLHLDIQHDSIRTVQDALAYISQPQSGEQRFLQYSSSILTASDTMRRGRYNEDGKSIQLAPELEIPLDIMVPTSQRPSEPPHYKLYGVLYHHGNLQAAGIIPSMFFTQNGDGDAGEVWLCVSMMNQ
ncbi:hypothetical protein BGY98DRAFT_598981 [Russula aff. rugulosa BPL654]|nr:hypothetical protein BGY98DRAFT_598981 [Russula aff. rugulosa BPL654]